MTGPLSSAEASLYCREDWREGNRERVGDDGKGKKREARAEARPRSRFFPLSIVPRALSIFSLLLFLLGYPAGAFAELGESDRAQRSVQSLHG